MALLDMFRLQSQPLSVLKHDKIMVYIIIKNNKRQLNFQSLTLGLKPKTKYGQDCFDVKYFRLF